MAMTQKERARFLHQAGAEGLPIDVARKLLRYGSTLHRLAEAQCNGDWPFNGDRDRPDRLFRACEHCNGTAKVAPRPWQAGGLPKPEGYRADDCLDCQGTGKLQTNGRERMRWDAHYSACKRCESSGCAQSVLLKGGLCPDCRTEDAVKAAMPEGWQVEIQGDPRGYPLRIKAPSGRELMAG